MQLSIPELLIQDGFVTQADQEKIDDFSKRSGLSYIKILLNFGYLSRKNYERSLINAGWEFKQIRDEDYDLEVLEKIELKFADAHLALPLRVQNGKIVTLMANPSDELFIDYIKFTYDMEPEIILASDLDITWLSHVLLGQKYVKSAVFELLHRDPDSSALTTFTTPQLIFTFGMFALVVTGLMVSFVNTTIAINVLLSSFFLISIVFKLFWHWLDRDLNCTRP
jgi:hypothetical protein